MKNLAKFVYSSRLFKLTLMITISFITIFWIFNKSFDKLWNVQSYLPLTDLNEVYSPPLEYDNLSRINIKITGPSKIAFESNKLFKLLNSPNSPGYYDTAKFMYPDTAYEYHNKFYFQFEHSSNIDSLILVISKTPQENIYWNQIFYSSVIVSKLNNFTEKPEEFRIKYDKLVDNKLLNDNDTLINTALNFFNDNKDTLKLADCATNSIIFKSICERYALPCRIIGLQGGDATQMGYDTHVGYPLHALCEVYSSKFMKWYVIDPTYGFRFKRSFQPGYLNAIEISNTYFFNTEREIIQDSVLSTKRSLVERDYFKYYENIFYNIRYRYNRWFTKVAKFFFNRSDYYVYQASNNLSFVKNTYYYFGFKLTGYIILTLIYLNTIFFLIIRALYKVKKPAKQNNLNNT